MSAPAAKAFSEPVRTMAEMVGLDWKERRAVLSSLIRGVQRAFRALGRLSWTVGFVVSYVLELGGDSWLGGKGVWGEGIVSDGKYRR
jgi:hypothetical protein